MNTQDIQKFMKKIDSRLEFNVFAANRIPVRVHLPCYLISNLDPDTKSGSHWIAIFINVDGVGEYFDSFGRKPTGYHTTFLERNTKRINYNSKVIQNYLSSVCGIYCLVYIHFRYKGISMSNFIKMFSNDTLYNDLLISEMLKTIFF